MRRLLVASGVAILTAVWTFALAPWHAVQAQGKVRNGRMSSARPVELRGGPKGLVKTAAGLPIGGLMVQLISQKTSIRTTVYTDETGRYEFPKLDAGDYVLRIARPLEFRRYQRDNVRINGATPLSDIVVERVSQSEFLPPTPDILPQLTGAEWVVNMPGSAYEKKTFVNTCGLGCHTIDYPFRVRFDEAGWRTIVDRMNGYRTLIRPTRANEGYSAQGNPAQDLVVSWLSRIRGLESPVPPIKPFPRPTGAATRVVVTEYELPWSTVNVHDVAGDAAGNIWFTLNRSPFIGKLDPMTGKVTEYRTPNPPPMVINLGRLGAKYTDPPGIHPGLHWIQVDHNTGIVWATNTWAEALYRLDPKTGEFQVVNTGLFGNVGLSPDGLLLWRTEQGKIKQYDTRTVMQTGKPVREFPLKTIDNTYGNFFSWDGKYFGGGQFWFDIEKGELREFTTIEGGTADRGDFDPAGNLWAGNRRVGTIRKYDPKTNVATEYSAPTPYVNFYTVRADKNGEVWAGEMSGGRIARFNPKTQRWIEYVLPTPWSLDFHSWIDNATDPPTYWYGDQYGIITRVQPLE